MGKLSWLPVRYSWGCTGKNKKRMQRKRLFRLQRKKTAVIKSLEHKAPCSQEQCKERDHDWIMIEIIN